MGRGTTQQAVYTTLIGMQCTILSNAQSSQAVGSNSDVLNPSAFKLRHTRPGTVSLALSENDDGAFIKERRGYKNVQFLITTGICECALCVCMCCISSQMSHPLTIHILCSTHRAWSTAGAGWRKHCVCEGGTGYGRGCSSGRRAGVLPQCTAATVQPVRKRVG